MSDMIDITDLNLAYESIGEDWEDFNQTLMPEMAIIFNTSFNLIKLLLEEDTLSLEIKYVLIDDSLENANKINNVRFLLIRYLIDILGTMGVEIDKDHIDPNSIFDLVNILNTIYTLDGMEDLFGIVDILQSDTSEPKEKLIQIVMKINDLDDDGNLPFIIGDVSSNFIRGCLIGLNIISEEDNDIIEPSLAKRIRLNKELLKGTLAHEHINNGGCPGVSFSVLNNLFINELGNLMIGDMSVYFKNMLALMLISGLTNKQILESYEVLIGQFSDDLPTLFKGTEILEKQLVLEREVDDE